MGTDVHTAGPWRAEYPSGVSGAGERAQRVHCCRYRRQEAGRLARQDAYALSRRLDSKRGPHSSDEGAVTGDMCIGGRGRLDGLQAAWRSLEAQTVHISLRASDIGADSHMHLPWERLTLRQSRVCSMHVVHESSCVGLAGFAGLGFDSRVIPKPPQVIQCPVS